MIQVHVIYIFKRFYYYLIQISLNNRQLIIQKYFETTEQLQYSVKRMCGQKPESLRSSTTQRPTLPYVKSWQHCNKST